MCPGSQPHCRKPIAHCPPVDTVNAAPGWPLLSSTHPSARETSFTFSRVHSASRGRLFSGREPSSLPRSALGKGLWGCLFWEESSASLSSPRAALSFLPADALEGIPPSLRTTSHLPLFLCSYFLPLPFTPHNLVMIDSWPGVRTRESIKRLMDCSWAEQLFPLLHKAAAADTSYMPSLSLFGSLPSPPISLD